MKSWELHPYLMYWPPLSQYVWNISTKLRTLRITSLKYPTYIVEENKKYFQLMGGMKYPFSGYHLLQRIKLKTTYCGLFALEISDMRIRAVNLNLKLTISGFVIHASHIEWKRFEQYSAYHDVWTNKRSAICYRIPLPSEREIIRLS